MSDPRDQFEPQYALAHGLDPLQVKFERAATGAYRDPSITRAFRIHIESLTQRLAA
jgi:hypothetical protein